MQARGHVQPRADRAAVIGLGGEQVGIHWLRAQRLHQRHAQQAGRMLAKAVGHQPHAQARGIGARWWRHELAPQRCHAGLDRGGGRARALQLLGRARRFGKEAEWRDAARARGHALAQCPRQTVEVGPVA